LGIRKLYFLSVFLDMLSDVLSKKVKFVFKDLLLSVGCSEKAVDELWKWYDFSNKKGVASF
jgi:hypothetical protein